ncbi:MAG: class I SAM-dependent methyltransferase [Deltaproteobacteria bacterium]|nr:class I SAM-dependent methyltransferase [Deltaproteobacteria bacterium]
MVEPALQQTLAAVAQFYDARQVGETGGLGFRRTTRLSAMLACLDRWVELGIIVPGQSRFLDIGCGDGRVNLWLSYLVHVSVGIEIDEWTLDEYGPLRDELAQVLAAKGLPTPPDNLFLFHGDSLESSVHDEIRAATQASFADFDLFFTFLTLHDEIAPRIAADAKPGAVFIVYGLDNIVPRYDGLTLLEEASSRADKLVLYRKG